MDLKSLRASRNSDFSKITAEFEKDGKPEGGSKSYEDNRFWKPERDKAGNASATIRFLNRTEGDELPWVKSFSHAFQGPTGRWFIDDCLTTIDESCPVCEANTKLWNSTTDDKSPERKQARTQKRKLNYIANILVVNDPKHPENNGKVFLFKFGKKIFDKIMDKARPTFEDEQPVNVFDYWEGANFKLRMKVVDKFPNYDSSEWEAVSPVAEDDEDILEIVKQQHKLADLVSKSKFKSYDDQKKRLEQVLSGAEPIRAAAPQSYDEMEDEVPAPKAAPKSKPAPQPKAKAAPSEDDDDMLSYFQSIADDN